MGQYPNWKGPLTGVSGPPPAPATLDDIVAQLAALGLTGVVSLPDVTGSRAAVFNSSRQLISSGATSDELNRLSGAKVFNVKSPQFGAVGDGVTNDLAAVQAAIDAAVSGSEIEFPPGTYKISGSLAVTNKSLRFIGRGVTLLGDGSDYVINATGGISAYTNIDSNAVKYANTIVCANAADNFVAGDLIKIISNANFSAATASQFQGEIHMVESVSGSSIKISNSLNDTYNTANTARIAKVTPISIVMDGDFLIKQTGASGARGMNVRFGLNCYVAGRFLNCKERALQIDDCYGGVFDVITENSYYTGTGTSYGVAVINSCMYCRVLGQVQGAKHAITFGANSSHGVSWDVQISVVGTAHASSTDPIFDSHPTTGRVVWKDCLAIGNSLAEGYRSHARETFLINCRTIKCNAGLVLSQASVVVDKLVIRGLDCSNVGASVSTVFLSNSAGASVVDFYVDDVTTDGTAHAVSIAQPVTGKWAFSRIRSNGGGILTTAATATTLPTTLVVSDSYGKRAATSSNIYGVFLNDTQVQYVYLNNIETLNCGSLFRNVNAITLMQASNCIADLSADVHFRFSASVTHVAILGGRYANSNNSGGYLARSHGTVTYGALIGVRTEGANIAQILFGAFDTVYHSGCDFHVSAIAPAAQLYLLAGSINHPLHLAKTGTPESAVAGPIGCLFSRLDGGAVTSLYVKESGTGNTGWVAK